MAKFYAQVEYSDFVSRPLEELEAEAGAKEKVGAVAEEEDDELEVVPEMPESDDEEDLMYEEEFKKDMEEHEKQMEMELETEEEGSDSEEASELE